MNISIFMFAFSEYISKWGYNNSQNNLSPIDFVFARSMFLILFGLAYARVFQVPSSPFKNKLPLIYLRNILGVITFLCFFYSLKHIALFVITFVLNLSPLFTAIYGRLILKENLSWLDLLNMILSMVGVGLIVYG